MDEPLPWDMIDIGVSKEFLQRERKQALAAVMTPECRTACSECGLLCALQDTADASLSAAEPAAACVQPRNSKGCTGSPPAGQGSFLENRSFALSFAP